MVYLISHQRPMSELLSPYRKDIKDVYENEFVRMSQLEVSIEELEWVREQLIESINTNMTSEERKFLMSFKAKSPMWELLGVANAQEVKKLPSVRWKMLNLEQMPDKRHQDALAKLEAVLF